MSGIPLILFAKAPVAGHVKTRLCSDCSPEQAASIASILLRASLRTAVQHWPDQVVLAAWPDTSNTSLKKLAHEFNVPLVAQCGADLGEKMHNAMQQAGFPCAVMGADAPHISRDSLVQAHQILQDGSNAIGPSTDGGYYLIGLGKSQPVIFKNIEWGSERVLEPTLKRANFLLLAELTDIDYWSDVLTLAASLPELKQYLQAQHLS